MKMQTKEWAILRHNSRFDIELLQAQYVKHAYPRHSHDYYVISVIAQGNQSFTHKGTKYTTPAGGLILINPGDVHTGESADEKGFHLRSLYPTLSHMKMVMDELTGRNQELPFFAPVRVDDRQLSKRIVLLHHALSQDATTLEVESQFIDTLAQLIQRYARPTVPEPKLRNEKEAIRKARQYIDERFAQGIRLNALAQFVALSPFYLLRTFTTEVGMPPYAYLESVRIRHTQKLIEAGKPLAEIAAEVGFSNQSHMTRSFKSIIGVTPGQYARQIRD